MRYDEYQNKVRKAAGVKKFLYRFRFLFLTIVSIIAITGIVLFNTKGLITSSTPLSQMQYYYGQDIQYDISGFLTSKDDVGLEFQVDGEWTVDAPNKPGNYPVRPYSTNNYGGKIYGNTQTISIAPKPVTLSIKSTSIDYGEKPEINILDEDGKDGLVSGDTLTYGVKYTNLSTSDTPDCYVDLVTVKVEDPKGRDVTECYSFTTPASPVRINKRTLVFNPGKTTLTYDGSSHDTGSDIERIKSGKFDNETSLIEGDQVVSFPSVYQFTDAGKKSYTYEGKDFKIINSDGVDVTRHYNLNIGNGEFEITPAELVISSADFTKVYDGSPIEVPSPKVDEGTPLQGNDILKVDNLVSPFYKVGEVDNSFDFDIVDKDNPSISHKSNYHITVKTGKLIIKKAPAVHVNVSRTDDFINKYVSDFEVNKDNLVDYLTFHTSDLKGNDRLTYEKTKKNYNQEDTPSYTYDVKSNTYTLQEPSLRIFHEDGDDVTDCYESVSFSDGHQKVTDVKKKKVDIYLGLTKTEYFYKGAPVFKDTDLQESVTGLDNGVAIKRGSLIIPVDYQDEAYTIKPEYRLMKGTDDVTDYYDVEVHSIDVKIKKKSLWINIKGASGSLSKTYDGKSLDPVFTVVGLVDNDVDRVHHVVKVSFDDTDYGFSDKLVENNEISLDLNIKDAGKYYFKDMDGEDVDAAFKRILKWHIYESNDISSNEVTNNYDVHFDYEDTTVNIAKKQLEIKFDNMVHYYDGKPFSAHELEDNYEIVGGGKLAEGQKLSIKLDKDYKDIGTYSDFQNHILAIDVVSTESANGKLYTSNYDIEWKNHAFSLTIKKVKIVYSLDSSDIYIDPETNMPSIPYGNAGDDVSYGKDVIKFAESSDFRNERPDGAKNKLEENYVLKDKYKLRSEDTTGNIPGKIYTMTMENFQLVPNDKYQKYGYDTINQSMIDFTMYGLSGNQLGIHRRQLNLKISETDLKYLYNGKDGFDFEGFKFLINKININSLAFDDHLNIEWKPGYEDGLKISGDYADFSEQTFSNVQDMIKISVYNNGADVTNYYSTDSEGKNGYDNAVSGKELKIEGSFSVTYEKPKVMISLKNGIDSKSINAYDNTDGPEQLFEATLENTGFADFKLELHFSNTTCSTSRVGEYHFNVEDVSFRWKDCNFSWKSGSIECEGKTLYTLIVNRLKLNIDKFTSKEQVYKEHVYWYDGRELTLEKVAKDKRDPGEAYLYDEYISYFSGLYKDDEIHFERVSGGSLPKDESVDSYSLLDNFRITVRHKVGNNDFEDVTGNYYISVDRKQIPLEEYLWKFDDTTLSYKRTEEPSFERFYIYKFSGTLSYKFDKPNYYKSDMPISNGSCHFEFTSNLPDSISVDKDKFKGTFDPSSFDENSFGAKYPKLKKVTYDASNLNASDDASDSKIYSLNSSYLVWEEGGTFNTMDLTIKDSSFNIVRYPATVEMKDVRLTTLHEDVIKTPKEISLEVKNINSQDNGLNKEKVNVKLKDTVSLSTEGENIITQDDVIIEGENLDDYQITVKPFKLTYEKPTLMITMKKSDFDTYDGDLHQPDYSVEHLGVDGKEMSKNKYVVSLTGVQYSQSFVDAGIYSGFEITDYKVKVNNTTYTKDDFVVQYQGDVNYEIKKRTLTVNAKSFKASSEYAGLSTSEIASRLKEEIKKKPNTYLSYTGLLKGHSVSDFDVKVVIVNNGYYYMITPTKIVDASGNEVTSNYAIMSSMKAPLIIQIPASDDDFE